MYSSSSKPVDKGLGFDFSAITDLVKSALPAGLNIFKQQMQLKQVKDMAKLSQQQGYNVPVVNLPSSQMYFPQPTFGTSIVPQQQQTFMNTTTMLMLGGVLVGGLVLFKMIK